MKRVFLFLFFGSFYSYIYTFNASFLLPEIEELTVTSSEQRLIDTGLLQALDDVTVLINQGQMVIQAPLVSIDSKSKRLLCSANVHSQVHLYLPADELSIQCSFLEIEEKKKSFVCKNVFLRYKKYTVTAESARLVDENRLVLQNAICTTCSKKIPHWQCLVTKVVFTDERVLRVQGVKLQLGSLLTIPLPMRAFNYSLQPCSGFLAPTFSSGDEEGIAFAVPYYFLSDDFDSRFTLYGESNRGIVVVQRLRFFSSLVQGILVGAYGALHWIDLKNNSFFLEKEPLMVEGQLRGKKALSSAEVRWDFFIDDLSSSSCRALTRADFWQNTRVTAGGDVCCESALGLGMLGLYANKRDFVVDRCPEDAVVQQYQLYMQFPYVSIAKKLFFESFYVWPECSYDILWISLDEQLVKKNQKYSVAAERFISEEKKQKVARFMSAVQIQSQWKADYVSLQSYIRPGVVWYVPMYEEETQSFIVPSIQLEGRVAWPELLFKQNMSFVRVQSISSMKYQSYWANRSQSEHYLYGYDFYDVRNESTSLWQSIRVSFAKSQESFLLFYNQGIEFAEGVRQNPLYRREKSPSFPFKFMAQWRKKRGTFFVKLYGEHVGILDSCSGVWTQHGSWVDFSLGYVYTSSAKGIRADLENGHHLQGSITLFPVQHLSLHLSGVYRYEQSTFSTQKQECTFFIHDDCWQLGLGFLYEPYRLGPEKKNRWNFTCHFKILS